MRKGLLKSAIRDPNPVIFLENEILYGKSFEVPKVDDWMVPIGKARIARPGKHVTHRLLRHRHDLCAGAPPTSSPERASRRRSSICSTIRPMDVATVIESVKKTNRCVTVEEALAAILGRLRYRGARS